MAKETKKEGKGIPILAFLGITGALAGLFIYLGTRKAEAAPEEAPEIPPLVVVPFAVEEMIKEIKEAKSLAELDAYYYYIGQLFITRQISYVEYMALYRAYEARFYELTGVAA